MKKGILLLLLAFAASFGQAQTYSPGSHALAQKAIGYSQATPADARSMFYDAVNYKYRDYQSTSEVITYLNLNTNRFGHFPIYVHSGGTLTNGVWTGGTTTTYWFKDGVTNGDLVVMTAGGSGDLVSTNNLSDLTSATTARTNLGLGNVNNTADASKPVSTAQQTAIDAAKAFAIQRANHTGTQVASTISDFTAAVRAISTLITVNNQTGTTYTILSSDAGSQLVFTNSSPITVTVPAGLPVGFNCVIYQAGSGNITLNTSAVTFAGNASTTSSYPVLTIVSRATNNFYSTGGTVGLIQLTTPTLTATTVSDTRIDLSWTNVANESSYLLERSPNGSSSWTTINSPAANTTTYSNTGLTQSTHYYYRISAIGDGVTYSTSGYGTDDTTTGATPVTPIPTSGLQAYWKLDEASGNFVSSVGSFPLTRVNGVTTAAGKISDAATFVAGSNQSLTGSNSVSLSPTATGFTVIGWVKLTATGVVQTVVSKGGASTCEFGIYYNVAASELRGFMSANGTALTSEAQVNFVTAGTWHMFCMTYDGANSFKLSVDNGAQTSVTFSGPAYNGTGNFIFSKYPLTPDYPLDGQVDEVAVYNRVLSSGEITTFYNAGAGITY